MKKKPRLKKSELIAKISEDSGVQKAQVCRVIEAIPMIIRENVLSAGAVKFPNLGTFYFKERKARKGINPKTKEQITIPASVTITFKLAKNVKESLIDEDKTILE